MTTKQRSDDDMTATQPQQTAIQSNAKGKCIQPTANNITRVQKVPAKFTTSWPIKTFTKNELTKELRLNSPTKPLSKEGKKLVKKCQDGFLESLKVFYNCVKK